MSDVQTMTTAFDFYKQCCFCGANNERGTMGFAGERVCSTCGHGGTGEPDTDDMYYKRAIRERG